MHYASLDASRLGGAPSHGVLEDLIEHKWPPRLDLTIETIQLLMQGPTPAHTLGGGRQSKTTAIVTGYHRIRWIGTPSIATPLRLLLASSAIFGDLRPTTSADDRSLMLHLAPCF